MAEEYTPVGPLFFKKEAEIRAAVNDVKNDKTETNFLVLGYCPEKPGAIQLVAKGSGGLEELKKSLSPDFLGYGFYKIIGGDEESKRPKFIQITYTGEKAPLVKKGKMGVHVGTIAQLFVYTHVQMQAVSLADLDEAAILQKVKTVGGANYDAQRYVEKSLTNRPTSTSLVDKGILPDPKVPAQFVDQAKKLEKNVVSLKLEGALENRPDKNKLEDQNIIHAGAPNQQASTDALKLNLTKQSLSSALEKRPGQDDIAEKVAPSE